ncbi:MAG TPA: type II toxin-antitoxin system PemK/MazF family toxin [Verrucomicrobiota bacterium]|nr:type II toxin-antitoxin system PemK/MazF family toxin [Verrucomicrobiota bacterium]
MPAVHPGEVWVVDFGMAAKVRPALILTETPAEDELDLVTVVLHTTSLRGNRWELAIPKPFRKPGAFPFNRPRPYPRSVSNVALAGRLGL